MSRLLESRNHGILTLLILLSGLSFAAPAPPESKQSEAGSTATISYEVRVLRQDFDEAHALGSHVSNEQAREIARKEGLDGLQKTLANDGKLTLLYRADGSGKLALGEGESVSIFVGDEVPFVTSFADTSTPGQTKTSTTQSSVSSGLKIELSGSRKGANNLSIRYRIDFDAPKLYERDGRTLIGRVRLNASGTADMKSDEACLLGRFTRQSEGKPEDYIFVLIPHIEG